MSFSLHLTQAIARYVSTEGRFPIVLAIVFMIAGALAAIFGYRELKLASAAKELPQAISCADLADKGYGDNANLRLSGFILSPRTFAYEGDPTNPRKPWKTVWIPLLPKDGEYHQMVEGMRDARGRLPDSVPPATGIRVILKSTHFKDEASLRGLAGQSHIDGLVVSDVESPGPMATGILEQGYKGLKLNECLIVEHNRLPPPKSRAIAILAGAVIAMVASAVFLAARSRRPKPTP